MKKTKIVIPARLKSTRLPGKPLKKILGKEMIIRVSDICNKVVQKKDIVSAKRLMGFSIIYITFLQIIYVVDKFI